jgi:hypothetical protein
MVFVHTLLNIPGAVFCPVHLIKRPNLNANEVIGWFGGKNEYEEWHKKKTDMHKMDWELGID